MLATGYVLDRRYTLHDAGANHPERPERIATLIAALHSYGRDLLVPVEPRQASTEELLGNHDPAYIAHVAASARRPATFFDADTRANKHTFDAALLAAGGVLSVVDSIMAGDVGNGFALVRPPGHHAEADRAMGFCFFNNIAVAARYLRDTHRLERVLIVDWDVHHGNGTQRSFFAQNDVMFVSLHRYPFYPGTGGFREIGEGDGTGFTVNIPFPGGEGDAEYAQAFQEIVLPVARQFAPQFVLVSAGFDAHRLDPLGGMNVSSVGFRHMTRVLMQVATEHAHNRLCLVLEGGYSLEALSESVTAVLDELGGETFEAPVLRGSGADDVIAMVTQVHKPFWTI